MITAITAGEWASPGKEEWSDSVLRNGLGIRIGCFIRKGQAVEIIDERIQGIEDYGIPRTVNEVRRIGIWPSLCNTIQKFYECILRFASEDPVQGMTFLQGVGKDCGMNSATNNNDLRKMLFYSFCNLLDKTELG
jgi:hypothetical protein